MGSNEDEVARARLAWISAGSRPLGAPKRARTGDEDPDGELDDEESAPEAEALLQDANVPGPARPPNHPSARMVLASVLDPRLGRRYVVAVAALLLVGVALTMIILGRSKASPIELMAPAQASTPTARIESPVTSPEPEPVPVLIRVHVLGEVQRPGVVTVEQGAIVADALTAAGGLTVDADPGELNLAAPLSDGQQVVVGTTGEPRGEVRDAPGQAAGVDPVGVPDGLLNLNTASASQLEGLPGVGPVTANAIVSWREDNGGFSSVGDLQEVPGIGPKTYATLESLVTV